MCVCARSFLQTSFVFECARARSERNFGCGNAVQPQLALYVEHRWREKEGGMRRGGIGKGKNLMVQFFGRPELGRSQCTHVKLEFVVVSQLV